MGTKFLSYEEYFADSIYINFILTKTSRNSLIVHLLNSTWLNTTDKDYSMLGKVHANTSMYVVYFSYYLPNTAGYFTYLPILVDCATYYLILHCNSEPLFWYIIIGFMFWPVFSFNQALALATLLASFGLMNILYLPTYLLSYVLTISQKTTTGPQGTTNYCP